MSKITDTVTALARPVAEAQGCRLWDVEYVKEGGEWYLRIYLDRDGGVDINCCEAVSRAMDPILDEADPIEGSYIFEVSSAGAERVLKRPSDFVQFSGSPVLVKLYKPMDGRKELAAVLDGYEDGQLRLTVDGRQLCVDVKDAALVRLRVEF